MGSRSRLRHVYRRVIRRHGLKIALSLIILAVMAGMGLMIWLMSDIRFRAH